MRLLTNRQSPTTKVHKSIHVPHNIIEISGHRINVVKAFLTWRMLRLSGSRKRARRGQDLLEVRIALDGRPRLRFHKHRVGDGNPWILDSGGRPVYVEHNPVGHTQPRSSLLLGNEPSNDEAMERFGVHRLSRGVGCHRAVRKFIHSAHRVERLSCLILVPFWVEGKVTDFDVVSG